MCGLAGALTPSACFSTDDTAQILRRMTDAITHRGPDAEGHWQDPGAGIGLGHRRLSILDLSEAGAQPMVSASGRYVLCYNGEVYNHLRLRDALAQAGAAPAWQGHSDTETLLAGVEHWGLDGTLTRAEGMFALALWDRQNRVLYLARDRLGEKPLYYGWQGQGAQRSFLFGSELGALSRHPAFERRLNRGAITGFLRHGHVGQGAAIYDGIAKLRAGQVLTLADGQTTPDIRFYWDGAEVAATRAGASLDGITPQDAVARLDDMLREVTAEQMISDVPLGAFLSGGIDSSVVVGVMQHLSSTPVHSFSIGFQEERYNEARFAKEVAEHLGTRHTELYVTQDDLLSVVPQLAQMYDEPFADSSQIPTYLVARLAREHVTVALSGDGGDELFCGYDRYLHGQRLWRATERMPGAVRAAAGGAVRAVPKPLLNRMLEPLRPTPQGKEPWGQRLHRIAHFARAGSVEALHRRMNTVWRFPETGVVAGDEPPSILAENLPPRGDLTVPERMMQLDMLTYLPDDILTKVDRATMAVSLESRAPLLNHKIAEFAWALPFDLKVRDGMSKWVLRQVLYKYVPPALIDRPKMGFEVPIGLWLRADLRDWAAALLDRDRLTREGLLNSAVIGTMWDEHLKGTANWGLQLWNVCMFQAWYEARQAEGALHV